MDISIADWEMLDLERIAQLIYEIFAAGNPDWGESNTPAKIESYLTEFESDDDQSYMGVTYHWEDNLVGFVGLGVTRTSVEMNPTWLGGDPFVSPNPELDREEVGMDLISWIRRWAVEREFESIIFYRSHSESTARALQRFAMEMYQRIGFNIRERDIFMEYELENHAIETLAVPEGYDIVPVREVDHENLFRCYYETFSQGQSPFFFDQSDNERRQYFQTWSKPESLATDATIAILSGTHIAGFSFARPYGIEGNYLVEWMGVHPDHREHGLGEFLMRHIANVAKQSGYQTMSLSCAVTNTRGHSLYTKLGWYENGGETIMALKLK